jgi:hypothetical protein
MARAIDENLRFSATIGNLCYYVMRDRTYLREKSSLSRDRVLKSKEFEKTRKYASNFAIAARLASPIYKALPLDIRARWIYRSIAGEAASLLYQGKSASDVNDILWEKYVYGNKPASEKKQNNQSTNNSRKPRATIKSLKQAFAGRWEKQGKLAYDFKQAWKDPKSFDPESVRRLTNGLGYSNFLW